MNGIIKAIRLKTCYYGRPNALLHLPEYSLSRNTRLVVGVGIFLLCGAFVVTAGVLAGKEVYLWRAGDPLRRHHRGWRRTVVQLVEEEGKVPPTRQRDIHVLLRYDDNHNFFLYTHTPVLSRDAPSSILFKFLYRDFLFFFFFAFDLLFSSLLSHYIGSKVVVRVDLSFNIYQTIRPNKRLVAGYGTQWICNRLIQVWPTATCTTSMTIALRHRWVWIQIYQPRSFQPFQVKV